MELALLCRILKIAKSGRIYSLLTHFNCVQNEQKSTKLALEMKMFGKLRILGINPFDVLNCIKLYVLNTRP